MVLADILAGKKKKSKNKSEITSEAFYKLSWMTFATKSNLQNLYMMNFSKWLGNGEENGLIMLAQPAFVSAMPIFSPVKSKIIQMVSKAPSNLGFSMML